MVSPAEWDEENSHAQKHAAPQMAMTAIAVHAAVMRAVVLPSPMFFSPRCRSASMRLSSASWRLKDVSD